MPFGGACLGWRPNRGSGYPDDGTGSIIAFRRQVSSLFLDLPLLLEMTTMRGGGRWNCHAHMHAGRSVGSCGGVEHCDCGEAASRMVGDGEEKTMPCAIPAAVLSFY